MPEQRELTAQLAAPSGLETMSFRQFDCLVFSRGEILKMFRPASKRILMGQPTDRMVIGDLIVVFEDSLKRLKPPSEPYEFRDPIFTAPIANFRGLIVNSSLIDGHVDQEFIDRIGQLLAALPSDRSGLLQTFGRDFLGRSFGERFGEIVRFLRETVTFDDPVPVGINLKVTLIPPPHRSVH